MKTTFRFVSVLAFICASIWAIYDFKFDSIFALLVSLAGLLASFVSPKLVKKQLNQNQSISNNSEGIQAGRDVNIKK